MRYLIKLLGFFFFGLAAITAMAQDNDAVKKTDTTRNALGDLLKNEALINSSQLIRETDSIRKADSVRQVALLNELSQLKTTDNLKKVELLAEIEALRNSDRLAREAQRKRVDSLRAISKGFPVVPFQDTLFFVYSKLGPFTPQLRANHTVEQIRHIAADRTFQSDSLRIFRSEESTDLYYNQNIILTVTHVDAIWEDKDRDELAENYKKALIKSVQNHYAQTEITFLAKNIAIAFVILFVLFYIVKGVNILFKIVKVKILKGRNVWYQGLKISNYELFGTNRLSSIFILLINIIKWFVIFLLVYFALLLLFGIFPWTKPIADTLFEHIMMPLRKIAKAIYDYLPDLFTIIIILTIMRYVRKGLIYFRDEVAEGRLNIPGFYIEWTMPTYHVFRILLLAFTVILVYPYLPGSGSPIFTGVSVFLGVLLTFGSSGSLSNIISGLVLTYTRAFKIGDRVKIGDSVGDIVEKNLLVTRIRTINNEDITIPNSSVMSAHTVNYSTSADELGLCISSTITLAYDIPWRQVHELLIKSAKEAQGILASPEPYVIQKALNPFSVKYEINAYTNLPNRQAGIYSSLHQNIQDNFTEAGISLVAPEYYHDLENPPEKPKEK